MNISVEKFVDEALQKVDNKSKFIEKTLRPVLEQLDPGEASLTMYQIDIHISHAILDAVNSHNYTKVQALGFLAEQLNDVRKLCGLPETQPPLAQKQGLTREDLDLYRMSFTMYDGQRVRQKILNQAYGNG